MEKACCKSRLCIFSVLGSGDGVSGQGARVVLRRHAQAVEQLPQDQRRRHGVRGETPSCCARVRLQWWQWWQHSASVATRRLFRCRKWILDIESGTLNVSIEPAASLHEQTIVCRRRYQGVFEPGDDADVPMLLSIGCLSLCINVCLWSGTRMSRTDLDKWRSWIFS